MTQATLLDHHVWTRPDTWNAALENTAARRSSGRRSMGFWGFSAICCIGIIALVLGGIYLMTNRRKNQ
ncbi:hypothetical protein [Nocardia seriolae]|nr:hypothetical protein [Nocardia seriolae]MTJ60054.1 hypothetical protein [Nocardia seriolae]MTJ70124.1 hypothetical protein [Nocardia seriolae]MTJ85056.1 hypothetical protein [Nocardia seriolae]MTK29051.1 hypothetical protein [Nocardia seriolae]MTK37984.1 hypothetical protein [Nocardia seriolae]